MGALTFVLTVFLRVDGTALVVLVVRPEGKAAGLGAISGITETYWGKNKGRSMEGRLVKFTTILAVLFMGLAVILNLNIF